MFEIPLKSFLSGKLLRCQRSDFIHLDEATRAHQLILWLPFKFQENWFDCRRRRNLSSIPKLWVPSTLKKSPRHTLINIKTIKKKYNISAKLTKCQGAMMQGPVCYSPPWTLIPQFPPRPLFSSFVDNTVCVKAASSGEMERVRQGEREWKRERGGSGEKCVCRRSCPPSDGERER